jgi:hypothetical protein
MAALHYFVQSVIAGRSEKKYENARATLVPPPIKSESKLPIIKPKENQVGLETEGTAVTNKKDEVVGILPVNTGTRQYADVPAPSNQVFGSEPVQVSVFKPGRPEMNDAAMQRIARDATLPINNSQWGEAVRDLTDFTSQDTKVDKIDIDGKRVDKNIVKSAIFDNANYAPRDETRLVPKMITVDHSKDLPYSHFGPIETVLGPVPYMNHAMKDALVNDIFIDGSTDNRVVISDTGMRSKPIFIDQ